ncbi:MAG: tandem-95 repeat protein [Alphaproteobacteria bacterium]
MSNSGFWLELPAIALYPTPLDPLSAEGSAGEGSSGQSSAPVEIGGAWVSLDNGMFTATLPAGDASSTQTLSYETIEGAGITAAGAPSTASPSQVDGETADTAIDPADIQVSIGNVTVGEVLTLADTQTSADISTYKQLADWEVESVTGLQSLSSDATHIATINAKPSIDFTALLADGENAGDLGITASTFPSNDFNADLLYGLLNNGQALTGFNNGQPVTVLAAGTVDSDIDGVEAWNFTTGDGVVVAVIDSGVDLDHFDLADNIWINDGEIAGNGIDDDNNGFIDDVNGFDFHNNDSNPDDDNFHGTHVAGTIAAVRGNNSGIAGVAPDAEIMALKALGSDGNGSFQAVIDAIRYAVDNGADVINLSLGALNANIPQMQAEIDHALANDVVVISAAGNDSNDNDVIGFFPANHTGSHTISVANTDNNDALNSTSNFGATTVDISAPGTAIASAFPNDGIVFLDGTSMAAPHVAGIAALLRAYDPTLTATEVVNIILATGDEVPALDGVVATGSRANAFEALKLAAADDNPNDDFGDDETTPDTLTLNTPVNGELELPGDEDWLKVSLASNFVYALELTGSSSGDGTLSDPLVMLANSDGDIIGSDDDSLTGLDSQLLFTVDEAGDFFAIASAALGQFGTYEMILVEVDDFASDIDTTGTIDVGGSQTAALQIDGDSDGFVIEMEAGRTYFISVEGAGEGSGTLADSVIQLFDGEGSVVATDDNSGAGNDALLTFTATADVPRLILVSSKDNTGTGTYTLSVTAQNRDPIVGAASFGVTFETGFDDTLVPFASDPDGDALTFGLVSQASNGVAVVNADGTFGYTPDDDFSGTDSFVYSVSDGNGGTDTATVTLTVSSSDNQAPVANAGNFNATEDVALSDTLAGLASDADGDALTFALVGAPDDGVAVVNADGTFTYTPDANFNGTDSFQYSVSDGEVTVNASVTISVDGVEDAPIAQDDSFSTDEGVDFNGTVATNDSDGDGDALTYQLTVGTPRGTVVLAADGSFTYTADEDFFGTETFTYSVSDGDQTDTATATITVNPINDAPVAEDDSFTTDEDVSLSDTVATNDGDPEEDPVTFSLVTDVVNGDLTFNADGSFSYTPDTNVNGSDSFTYRISDGDLTDTATVSITITPVNDAPIAVNDSFTGSEDTLLEGNVSTNDSDIETPNTNLIYTLLSGPTNASAFSLGQNGAFSYTGAANFNGSDSFSYIVSDGEDIDTATVSLTINAVNDAPVAGNDSFATNEDTALNGTVAGNDSDIDGDNLTYAVTSDVSNGSLTLNADGTFTYTPDANFNGTDSFSYSVSDGALTDTATVSLTINAVNDAPVAQNDSFSTDVDERTTGDVSTNDIDIDSPSLTYSLVQDAAGGSLTFNSDGTFTYTPDLGFSGTETFVYRVSDGTLTDTATVTLNYDQINDVPLALDDAASGDEDTAITGNVLSNDTDVDGDDLTVSLVTNVSDGTLTLNADGTFSYTGDANFNGTDGFTYSISDGNGGTDTASVVLTINAVNDNPVAVNDVITGDEDTVLTGNLLSNDSDVDGDDLTFQLLSDIFNGNAVIGDDGAITYTPNANFNGTDSFTYLLRDGNGGSDTATVTFVVNPLPDAPILGDDAFTIDEDTSLNSNVRVNDFEVDGEDLTYSLVSGASNGSLTFNADGSFSYTPTAHFNGTDSFTYSASDGSLTDTATVTLTINAVNDVPVAQNDTAAGDEDTAITGDVSTNDSDADGDGLTYAVVTDVSDGTLTFNANGSFSYTGDANFNGTDSFTYRVSDGNGGSDTASVTLTINSVNDNPVAQDDLFQGNEDSSITGNVGSNDSDVDGDDLTYSLLTTVSSGILTFNADGSFTYTPDTDSFGTESFTYSVSDGNGGTDSATVTLRVFPLNDAPLAQDDAVTGEEDTQITGNVITNDNDVDGDDLTISLVTDVENGSLTLNTDGTFNYTGDANFNGTDSFTYRISDGDLTDTATVNLTITPANDAPVAQDDTATGDEDTAITGDVSSNDVDIDGDDLTFSVVSDGTDGTLTLNADGTFSYTGAQDYNGTDSFTYRVSDGELTDTATVSLTITAVNDAPIAVDDNATGTEDAEITGDVSSNDFDVEADDLTFTVVSNVSNGSLTLNTDGSFSYTGDQDFNGSDSFTYRVSDGELTDTATVTLVVNAVNDAPIAQDDTAAGDEDTEITGDVSTNDSDVEGAELTFSLLTDVSDGTLSFNADGTFSYTGDANFFGTDSFTYRVSDGVLTDTATVSLTINSVNDAPVAQDDSASGDEDNSITGNVSTNDSDVDGDDLTFTVISDVSNGSLDLDSDGSFSYTGDPNFNGTDSFTYRVSDGNGGTDTATVTLTVNAVNDAPVAQDDTASGDEDTAIIGDVSSNDGDVDGDDLTYTVVTDATDGTLTLNADGTFSYTGDANFNGTDSFTYRVSDGVLTDTATVSLTINAVNDAPVAVNDAASGNEDAPITGDVSTNDTDVEGDDLTFTVITDVSNGDLDLDGDGSFSYVGDTNFNGTDSFTYRVSDGNGGTDTATVTLTVNAVNDAPVAVDDAFSGDEDTEITGNVGTNDVDPENDDLTFSLLTDVSDGDLTFNADGSFSYTGDQNFNGTDSFTYRVSDGDLTDTATVQLTIDPVNDAPTAGGQLFSTDEDTELTGTLGQSDSDPDGDDLVYSVVSTTAGGALTLNGDGSFTYTPLNNFNGSDSFTYRVSDGNGGTDTATVTITVDPVNDAPDAANDSFNGQEEQQISGNVTTNDDDIDGDDLTVSLLSDVSDGTLDLQSDGSFTYTGDADFTGNDSFTYRVTDGNGGSDTATVTLIVTPVNDAPVAQDDAASGDEDTQISGDVSTNDSDADGDDLSFSVISGVSNGSLTFNADGTFSYTGDQDFNGTDSFTYRVSDDKFGTDTATVTLTVTAVNDAPVAQSDAASGDEDTLINGDVSTNDSDVEGDDLTFSLVSSTSNGDLTFNADGTFSYTGDQDFNGADSFIYRVSDGDLTDTASVSITIDAVNDAPVAQDDTAAGDEDTPITGDVSTNDSDVDGDDLSFSLVSPVTSGALTFNADGTFSYTGNQDFNGTDSFTYRVSDGDLTDTATVQITVNAVNDAPVAVNDAASGAEDTQITGDVSSNDTDIEGDDLTFSLVSNVSNGSLTFNADGTFSYTGDQDFNGADSFTYRVTDGDLTDTATVSLTVTPVNDAPVAQDDAASGDEDTPITGNVSSNDTDVDGDDLTFSLVSSTSNGELTFNADGTFSYTGNQDFNGADSFTYRVSDGDLTDTASVSITVAAVNDAPVAINDAGTGAEDNGAITGNVLNNDTDVEGDDLSASLLVDAENGSVVLTPGGNFVYTPDDDFNGTDSFTYRVSDGKGGTDTGTVNLTITPVNDAPVANDDQFSGDEDTQLQGNVITNDSDVDGDNLTVTLLQDTTDGSLNLNSDGSFTYTGDADFSGSDSFTYRVSDGELTDTATVSLNIAAANDAPVAQNDSFTVAEDQTASGSVLLNDSDVDSDGLTTSLVSGASNGQLVLNSNGTFSYTPAAHFNGTDSFTYRVSDGDGGTDTATVTLTVTPVADAPVANADLFTGGEDDAEPVFGNVLDNDSDADGDTLTASLVSGTSNGDLTLNSDGSFSYTPDDDFAGTDSFVYRVSDGNGGNDTATVTLEIAARNDAPVAQDDAAQGAEDVGSVTGNVLTNDSDVDGDNLTASLLDGASNGSVVLTQGGSFVYTPDADFNGTDSFTYQVSDGQGGVDTGTVTLSISAVNDAPIANNDQFGGAEDQTITGSVTANDSDVDGDSLTVSLVSGVSDGNLTLNSNGSFSYTGDANFNGVDSFTYRLSDGNGGTDTASVTLVVAARNDAPVAIDDQFSGAEDQAITGNVTANDSDIDGDSLTVSLVSDVSDGSLTLNSNGSFSYTGDANFNGADSFTYRISDGNGGTDTASVTISVAAVNDAPVANNDQFAGTEDQAISGSVTANDSDVDGDDLTTSLVSGVSNGALVLNSDGSFTYTPDADFTGADSFTYRLSDGAAADTATVTLVISPSNDAPVAVNDAAQGDEDTQISGNLLANDTDADGDDLSASLLGDASNGSVLVTPGGSFVYTPDPDFNGSDSFTYQVSDGNGGVDAGTVTVTVSPVNDAPTGVDDAAQTDADTTVSGNVLVNDTDPENDALSASLLTGASNGSVVVTQGGSFVYTPDAGFSGTDSFSYTVSDGSLTDTATVTVTVAEPPEDPENDNQGETPDTAGTAATDVPVTDRINFRGDRDWFSIQVFAGGTYIIEAEGLSSGEGTLPDPLIRLLSASGNTLVAGNNNGGTGNDARLAFTSNVTGTFNVEISDASQDAVGSYKLTVNGTDWTGTNGRDTFVAGARDDVLNAGRGSDRVEGGAGDDTILGGNGSDNLQGNDGDDLINGQNGFDRLVGGDGNDTIFGGNGSDLIQGEAGDDILNGQSGSDLIIAGSGNDIVNGGGSSDLIKGNGGDDQLNGGGGKDFIEGASGNDILTGGKGRDILNGGTGADIFAYENLNESGKSKSARDRILDFDPTEGDRIDLSALDGSEDFTLVSGFSGAAGELWQDGNRLKLDASGNGKTDFQIELPSFSGTLTDDDFIL